MNLPGADVNPDEASIGRTPGWTFTVPGPNVGHDFRREGTSHLRRLPASQAENAGVIIRAVLLAGCSIGAYCLGGWHGPQFQTVLGPRPVRQLAAAAISSTRVDGASGVPFS